MDGRYQSANAGTELSYYGSESGKKDAGTGNLRFLTEHFWTKRVRRRQDFSGRPSSRIGSKVWSYKCALAGEREDTLSE